MIELHEDASLTLDHRIRDQNQAKRQAMQRAQLPPDTRVTFTQNGEMEIVAHDQQSNPVSPAGSMDVASSHTATHTITVQPTSEPPPDPATAMRNLRFAAVGMIVLILLVLWIRQRRTK